MQKAKTTGFLALVVAAAPAMALMPGDFKVLTTGDLVKLCSVRADDPLYHSARAFCFGYLDAVWDYHEALTLGPEFNRIVCPGSGVTLDQVADALMEWAGTKPKKLAAEEPVHGVMRAVAGKWPCPDQ